jgi:hypothetical protein
MYKAQLDGPGFLNITLKVSGFRLVNNVYSSRNHRYWHQRAIDAPASFYCYPKAA